MHDVLYLVTMYNLRLHTEQVTKLNCTKKKKKKAAKGKQKQAKKSILCLLNFCHLYMYLLREHSAFLFIAEQYAYYLFRYWEFVFEK